ncbi:MAG: GMC family oxidoreductase [Anaerolineae bacterium]
MSPEQSTPYDFVIIGSGFGGSVAALRLVEKGYRVLVLERGRRFRSRDFPRRNWDLRRYLWMPALRLFGIQQMTFFQDVLVMHGCGVGGGSLVYANVLMEPDDALFEAPGWRNLADWKTVLRPHYDTAKAMLGVTPNPHLWPADRILREIATERGNGHSFQPAHVGVFFGEAGREGELVPDPYFGGEGPPRAGCTHCGGCMVGCRYNAKNTLDRNYLYLAEKRGARIQAEAEVTRITPLSDSSHGARYEVTYRRSTALLDRREQQVQARNVVIAAGVLGTLRLLFHCRDEARTLPALSPRLGTRVRTNSEALQGVTALDDGADYSRGIAITSVIRADDVTHVEPVRFSDGSSFIRVLSAPLLDDEGSLLRRLAGMLMEGLRHPLAFLNAKFLAPWARRTTILLIMQTVDNTIRLRPGRSFWTGFRRGLVSERESEQPIRPDPAVSNGLTRRFARLANGVPQASITETLLGMATTAHILGGVPMGRSPEDGVVDRTCQVFNYPGLYVVDGSIMPANPGINPSLTITALAEYAMSHIPPKGDSA